MVGSRKEVNGSRGHACREDAVFEPRLYDPSTPLKKKLEGISLGRGSIPEGGE
jgi:hypothetical protein